MPQIESRPIDKHGIYQKSYLNKSGLSHSRPNFVLDYNDISSNSDIDPLIVTSNLTKRTTLKPSRSSSFVQNPQPVQAPVDYCAHPLPKGGVTVYEEPVYQSEYPILTYSQGQIENNYTSKSKPRQIFFPSSVVENSSANGDKRKEEVLRKSHSQIQSPKIQKTDPFQMPTSTTVETPINYREISHHPQNRNINNININNRIKISGSRLHPEAIQRQNYDYYHPYNMPHPSHYYYSNNMHNSTPNMNSYNNNLLPYSHKPYSNADSDANTNPLPNPISYNMSIKLDKNKRK